MCGIAGCFTINNQRTSRELAAIAERMAKAIVHRGPDHGAGWVSETTGLALSHRRLSIIDLSTNGNQPMHSEQGWYVIVFNGEIYNHRELRSELLLRGRVFRGHSDTEILLTACEEWGVDQTIRKCVGMFAIGLWDTRNEDLYLIRDRMGEKPLYYAWQRNSFLFASELKAIREHPDFVGALDRNALSLYFRHRYIPSPYSIYTDVHKLEPGTILRVPVGRILRTGARTLCEKRTYWSLREIAEESEKKYNGTPQEAVDTLEALLARSIEGQMIADVPLGAFLSGGIDSSTIVALMQQLSAQPTRTFTIGFAEQEYNEAACAARVARHLGCDHTELYVAPQEVLDVIPRLPHLYDEPFADPSEIPTFLVSQLAKQGVTVSLSGDAGDELFYGYQAYPLLFARWNIARRIRFKGEWARKALLKLVQWAYHATEKQLAVAGSLLSAETCVDVYRAMMSQMPNPCGLVVGSCEPVTLYSQNDSLPTLSSKEQTIMLLDALSYLPDDILVKVDRAAMACSLETRIPLLDHRIVEFAFGLPFDIKFREGATKWPLRQILYKYVSRDLVDRPKKGFAIPLAGWLRGELKGWVYDSLERRAIESDGVLNADIVERYLGEHMGGRQDHSEVLWSLLVFQGWLHQEKRADPLSEPEHARA